METRENRSDMQKITLALKIFFAYITLCGLAMFPCFIAEEAIQVAVWGTWPAQDAKDWDLVMQGCNIVDNINTTLKIINYSIGWIQPLAFFSYKAYSNATDYYIESLKAKIFAHSPESLIGQTLTVTINLRGATIKDSLYHLKNSSIFVSLPENSATPTMRITSIVKKIPQGVLLTQN